MISRLQFISHENTFQSHLQNILLACEAGVKWIQLRVKNKPVAEILAMAYEAKEICDRFQAKLIINDHPEIAVETGAYGVHLGKEDMPIPEARKITGPHLIIGATANTYADIEKHHAHGANYIGLGPYRFTSTKEKLSPILHLEGYAKILRLCNAGNISIPVIAIGGLRLEDIRGVLQTNVHGIAVSSLITGAADKKEVVTAILKLIHHHSTCQYVNNSR